MCQSRSQGRRFVGNGKERHRPRMMFNLNELISGAGSVAIAGHVRPDGDAVGSTLALYNYIKKRWPEKETALYLEEPSETFSYLKGFEEAVTFKLSLIHI